MMWRTRFFVPLCQINPEEFGLGSNQKKGLKRFLKREVKIHKKQVLFVKNSEIM